MMIRIRRTEGTMKSSNPTYRDVAAIAIVASLAAAFMTMPKETIAQAYPTKAVRIIVPHPPGSVVDIPVRGAAQAWS